MIIHLKRLKLMIQKNDLFDYGYKIFQNKNYFKFSIDSILLAEFVSFNKNSKILDMCTGNAPIPMILTSKNSNLHITGVEMQEEIYNLAVSSIKINNLDNIVLLNSDIKSTEFEVKYDIVTCNPPYFKVTDKKTLNSNHVKSIARHEIAVDLESIIATAYKNLKDNGTFYLVHRTERFLDVIEYMKKYKFGLRKICYVFTKKDEDSEFFLVEASKCKKNDPKITYLNIENLITYKGIFERN